MEADGLFALEGMHETGAEQSLKDMREALEYYCFNFLRPWLQDYFYHKAGYGLSVVSRELTGPWPDCALASIVAVSGSVDD